MGNTRTPKLYVIHDEPRHGGDGTFLVHLDHVDGSPPPGMQLDPLDDAGLWHRDPKYARIMTMRMARLHLIEVDGGELLRHRLIIRPVTTHPDRHRFPKHGCGDGECGGLFRCGTCRGMFGWCLGAADRHPDDCDDCANRKEFQQKTDRMVANALPARRKA